MDMYESMDEGSLLGDGDGDGERDRERDREGDTEDEGGDEGSLRSHRSHRSHRSQNHESMVGGDSIARSIADGSVTSSVGGNGSAASGGTGSGPGSPTPSSKSKPEKSDKVGSSKKGTKKGKKGKKGKDKSSSSKNKKSKGGKKGRKGKRGGKKGGKKSKKQSAEDKVDIPDAVKDEDDEQLQPYDPMTFPETYSSTLLSDPVELQDQKDESEFTSRCNDFNHLLLETWRPKIKKRTSTPATVIELAARMCKMASNVPRRVLALMKSEGLEEPYGHINLNLNSHFNGQGHGQGHGQGLDDGGGIASWMVKMALVSEPSTGEFPFLRAPCWSWLPSEWWDIEMVVQRSQNELAIVNTARDIITRKMERIEYVKEEVHENRLDLQDFLKGTRSQILKISSKRREKLEKDIIEKAGIARSVGVQERKIMKAQSKIKYIQSAMSKIEGLLAAQNMAAIFSLLEVEITEEELEEAASDPDVKGRALRRRAYILSDQKKDEVPILEESIKILREKHRIAKSNVKMFDRLCNRGNTWLRNMGE